MTRREVQKRAKELWQQKLELEAQLTAVHNHQKLLRDLCPHPKAAVKEWNHTDYKGETDHYWECDDCGAIMIN